MPRWGERAHEALVSTLGVMTVAGDRTIRADASRAASSQCNDVSGPTVDAPEVGGLAASTRMAAIRAALFGTPTAPIMVDRFVLLRPLGAGGMGEVFEAYDPRLDRRVALKLVSRDDACDERIRLLEARMGREAQAMARLSHPNVVQIHDFDDMRQSALER